MCLCECVQKEHRQTETFQLQLCLSAFHYHSLYCLFTGFSTFGDLSRHKTLLLSSYPSPQYTHTSICYAPSLSLVLGSSSAYQMHLLILVCDSFCLFSVLFSSFVARQSSATSRRHLGTLLVLKQGEVMWLILIFSQPSAASASTSLCHLLGLSLSRHLSTPGRRQMNHSDADRIFLGHFFSHMHVRLLLLSLGS